MLNQFQYQTTADYNKAFQEAVGSDIEGFTQKRDRLFERWCEKRLFPSEESVLMRQVLSKRLSPSPVDCALVVDNLEFFRSSYTHFYGQKPELALQIACICGAKKIALFLLDILKTDLTNPKMHYLLEYIMTSDIKWAEEVAHAMIKAGQQEMPKGISAFPTTAEYLKIQDIFIETKEKAEKKAASEHEQVSSSFSSGKLDKR